MTSLPKYFRWRNTKFVEVPPTEPQQLIVADSWRVHNGITWELDDHLQRFFAGLTAQAPLGEPLLNVERRAFRDALQHKLIELSKNHPGGDLFPRISVEPYGETWQIVLLVRPAPEPRPTTSLWIPPYTDPRTTPHVKGPDIDLLRGLVSEVSTDDLVLHDGSVVHETTTGALLIWQSAEELVLCQAYRQLTSISAQRIAEHAKSQNILVTTRPVTLQELASGQYPVWFCNTLHGISPVTTITSAAGETHLATHPATQQWQASWWTRFAE